MNISHLFLAFRVLWLHSTYLSYVILMYVSIVHKLVSQIWHGARCINCRYNRLLVSLDSHQCLSTDIRVRVGLRPIATDDPLWQWERHSTLRRLRPTYPVNQKSMGGATRAGASASICAVLAENRERRHAHAANELRKRAAGNWIFLAKAVPRARYTRQKFTFQRNTLRASFATSGLL